MAAEFAVAAADGNRLVLRIIGEVSVKGDIDGFGLDLQLEI